MLRLSSLTTKEIGSNCAKLLLRERCSLVHKLEPLENNTIIQFSLSLRGRMGLTITVRRIWVPPD
jgi:hypothetical protein